jgi:hypothetical protein
MAHAPLPPRSPDDLAAAAAALAADGACCGHTYAAHANDGCRVCQLQGRRPGAGRLCEGWRPADPWASPPPGSPISYVVGIEDSDALPCSTPGCKHRADAHRHDPAADSGLGACGVDGCGCIDWTYVIHDDQCESDVVGPGLVLPCGCSDRAAADGDVIDAEVLAPVHDAIRVALEGSGQAPRYVVPDYLEGAVAAVVTALEEHAGDVADYLRLDTDALGDAVELLRQVVMDYAPADCHRGCHCSAARARTFLAARGVQVG